MDEYTSKMFPQFWPAFSVDWLRRNCAHLYVPNCMQTQLPRWPPEGPIRLGIHNVSSFPRPMHCKSRAKKGWRVPKPLSLSERPKRPHAVCEQAYLLQILVIARVPPIHHDQVIVTGRQHHARGETFKVHSRGAVPYRACGVKVL